MRIDQITFQKISRIAQRARSVRVRQGYYGNFELIMKYGPFGLLRRTFEVDGMTLDALKHQTRLFRRA